MMKERRASSYSGRHFGHYEAATHSEYLSEVHARTLSLITKTGATSGRWSKGLSVMLEKIAGMALWGPHEEFGRGHGLVPEEIYSEKGKTAEDAILQQLLLFDIA